jgi:hypothetical protein
MGSADVPSATRDASAAVGGGGEATTERKFKLGARLEERRIRGGEHALVVNGVDPESAAYMAHLESGDVLVSVNGHAVSCFGDLARALDAASQSDAVTARVRRVAGGEEDIVVGALHGFGGRDRGSVGGVGNSVNSSLSQLHANYAGSGANTSRGEGASALGAQFEWLGALGAQQKDLQEFWKELKMALP